MDLPKFDPESLAALAHLWATTFPGATASDQTIEDWWSTISHKNCPTGMPALAMTVAMDHPKHRSLRSSEDRISALCGLSRLDLNRVFAVSSRTRLATHQSLLKACADFGISASARHQAFSHLLHHPRAVLLPEAVTTNPAHLGPSNQTATTWDLLLAATANGTLPDTQVRAWAVQILGWRPDRQTPAVHDLASDWVEALPQSGREKWGHDPMVIRALQRALSRGTSIVSVTKIWPELVAGTIAASLQEWNDFNDRPSPSATTEDVRRSLMNKADVANRHISILYPLFSDFSSSDVQRIADNWRQSGLDPSQVSPIHTVWIRRWLVEAAHAALTEATAALTAVKSGKSNHKM